MNGEYGELVVVSLAVIGLFTLVLGFYQCYKRKRGYLYLIVEDGEIVEILATWVSLPDQKPTILDMTFHATPSSGEVIEDHVEWVPDLEYRQVCAPYFSICGTYSAGEESSFYSYHGNFVFSPERLALDTVHRLAR